MALGRHTGLSPGLLSKLERNKMVPTLQTLLRVALVYGVGLDYFFSTATPPRALGIVRAADRKSFLERLGGREVAWEFECLDFTATERLMDAYRVRFRQAAARPRLHEHAGAEFLYLLRGKMGIVVAGVEHVLAAGDSILLRCLSAARLSSAQRASSRSAGGNGAGVEPASQSRKSRV